MSLIDEAAALGVFSVEPLGGDILLYPHLREVLESMSKHKFLPVMLSSKSFLSKEMARMLANFKDIIWRLQFSIDSTVDDVADFLVGRKDYCQRVFASIDNGLEAGLPVIAKAVFTPYNILTIPKLYRDMKKRGVEKIHLATYTRSGFHHTNSLFNDKDSFDWLETQINILKKEFPNDNIIIQNGPPTLSASVSKEQKEAGWKGRSMCTAGRMMMMICADGKVIPCEQMPETDEFFCGDVNHQSIQEVWDGERLHELTYGVPREKFKGQACYGCDEREDCHEYNGICIRDLSLYYGNIYQPPSICPRVEQPFVRRI